MADNTVIVTLSLEDAETVRTWQRQKASIGEVEKGFRAAKKAADDSFRAQGSGWAKLTGALSEVAKKARESQTAWGKGLAELGKQRAAAVQAADEEKKALEAVTAAAEEKREAEEAAAEAAQKAADEAKAAHDKERDAVRSVIANWVSVGGAIRAAVGLVNDYFDAIEEVKQSQAEVTFELDARFREFAAQAGVGDQERELAQKRLTAIAVRQAVPIGRVKEAAEQLVSSGYTFEQVTQEGGVTESMIAAMQAAAEKGQRVTPRELVASATRFLLAQGGAERGEQAQLPEEVRAELLSTDKFSALMQDVHALYTKANLQIEHLTAFAEAAPAMARAGIDPRTQLALAAQSVEVLDADTAATSLRNVISRMRTAGESKEKTEALASIGLKPEDIDMEGETVDEAFARFRDALAAASPVQQDIVLKKVFEEKGAQGASVWIQQADQLDMFRRMAADHSGFEKAHSQVTAGPAAAKERLETDVQAQRFGGEGAEDELTALAIQAERPDWRGWVAVQAYRMGRRFQLSQDTALRMAVPETPEGMSRLEAQRDFAQRVQQRVEAAKAPAPAQQAPPVGMGSAEPGPMVEFLSERGQASTADEAGEMTSEERQAFYGKRAKEWAEAEAAQAKTKEDAKLDKKAAADAAKQDRAQKAGVKKLAGDQKRLQRKADAAGKAAETQQGYAEDDQRRVDEIKRRITFKESQQRQPAGGKKTGPTAKQKAAANEEIRRLRLQLADAEREKAEHEKAANAKMDEQTKVLQDMRTLLAQFVGARLVPTAVPRVPQRAPAQIGGN
ncbi:MAG TPA: phage tail tape measure protein [Pirellulales bacterium]|nr:phage tail tape measure protein [Pirellulales bacterium]